MSTFDGIVKEFPRIRIDFFRIHPSQPPPLACFLSHIHSDHLQGLESLKSPFVYCSAATRRLLLRLEKYPHRMNFMKGILESRKQHYKHLKLVLKAIPLECPTEIELNPLEKIRVTLFNANHCPGAVMFLIEGDNRAVLYTGDIRSEPWWVNSLARNAILLPYTAGLKQLDQIYLDTTFAVKDDIYKTFPSKAEGIHELLKKVCQYSADTLFYLNAWTLGYEEVWIAMSSLLESSVHVDSYQSRLYGSLSNTDDTIDVNEYPALTGYYVGNHHKPGCLSTNSSCRIHSCEPGTPCHTGLLQSERVVWITPIITRSQEGLVVPELGAGGGGGDLYQTPELELFNLSSTREVQDLCKQLTNGTDRLANFVSKVDSALASRQLKISLKGLDLDFDKEIPLQDFLKRLLALEEAKSAPHHDCTPQISRPRECPTDDKIHFPYSRHSSYDELCDLVAIFRPREIYPCTVEEQTWTEDVSMKALFGHLCSGFVFHHDEKMRSRLHERLEDGGSSKKRWRAYSTENSQANSLVEEASPKYNMVDEMQAQDGFTTMTIPRRKHIHLTHDAEEKADQDQASVMMIKAVYDVHMARATSDSSGISALDADGAVPPPARPLTPNQVLDSQISISESLFESQTQGEVNLGLQLDGTADETVHSAGQSNDLDPPSKQRNQRSRRNTRAEAYQAAKLTLETSDSGSWDDLGIRTIGNKGLCATEEEL